MGAVRSSTPELHRLRIDLRDVAPQTWRRVLVPSSITLAGLHAVIQEAMGWSDAHLYEFEIGGARYGLDDEDDDLESPLTDAHTTTLASVAPAGTSFDYVYDFGDEWRHLVEVEEVRVSDPEATYPSCVDGEGACPPDDVGGVPGYEAFLAAGAGAFDPALFDVHEVNRRLRRLAR